MENVGIVFVVMSSFVCRVLLVFMVWLIVMVLLFRVVIWSRLW